MRHPLQHARHAYARRARDLPSVHAVFGEIDSVEQVSAFFKYCFMDEPRERRRRSLRPSAFLILARARPLPCSVQNGGIWEDAVERAICAQDQVVGRLAIPIQTGRAACATAAGNRRGTSHPCMHAARAHTNERTHTHVHALVCIPLVSARRWTRTHACAHALRCSTMQLLKKVFAAYCPYRLQVRSLMHARTYVYLYAVTHPCLFVGPQLRPCAHVSERTRARVCLNARASVRVRACKCARMCGCLCLCLHACVRANVGGRAAGGGGHYSSASRAATHSRIRHRFGTKLCDGVSETAARKLPLRQNLCTVRTGFVG